MTALTIREREELERCEAVIERGLQTFFEVGMALMKIRERHLYKQDFDTFEEYCRERWGFSKQHGLTLMRTAVVYELLSQTETIVSVLPQNTEQAKPLAQLKDPSQQAEAWQKAIETAPDGKVTGFHVQTVVNEFLGKEPPLKRTWYTPDNNGHSSEPSGHSQAWSPPQPEPSESSAYDYAEPDEPGGNGIKPTLQALMASGVVEWYTPDMIIERTLALFGGTIDLDPCSNQATNANPNVPALHHFTEADDGLSKDWFGRVYMNPPYGGVIRFWADKLADEYEAGKVSEAVALVPARTDTRWMRRFAEYPRCYIWGRLSFSEHDNSAPFPSVLIYLGNNLKGFAEKFGDVGDIYVKFRG